MFQDPLAEEQPSSSAHHNTVSRTQLYHNAKVPEFVEIIYPEFGGHAQHKMTVVSSAKEGALLHVEFTVENLDLEGCACPPPYRYSGRW